MIKQQVVYIGIDPGTDTGFASITPYAITTVKKAFTVKIHEAMMLLKYIVRDYPRVHIRVEDARKRKKYGKNHAAKLQGAGSIKRDCSIWEDFIESLKKTHPGVITVEFLHPQKGSTKINSTVFKKMTGLTGRYSNHARDAYMLIHDYKYKNYERGGN
tara:strand:- start:335 stop:808 length:474 start_codon:yes stop_codon:yes gene_type:complete